MHFDIVEGLINLHWCMWFCFSIFNFVPKSLHSSETVCWTFRWLIGHPLCWHHRVCFASWLLIAPLVFLRIWLGLGQQKFLDVSSHLYKRVCPPISLAVFPFDGPFFHPYCVFSSIPQKRLFLTTVLVDRWRSHALACPHALMHVHMHNNYACAYARRYAVTKRVRIVQRVHQVKTELTDGGEKKE